METVKVGRFNFFRYLGSLWRYRHLCAHLAKSDLQSRFRRSSLGLLWAMIHPVAFALLYALVMSSLFNQDFSLSAIYILSGLVIWEAVAGFFIQGANSLINSAGYLKQSPIPMLIFPVRTSITVTAYMLLGLIALAMFATAMKFFFGIGNGVTLLWVWAIPGVCALFVLGTAWSTTASYLNAHFRDTQQLLLVGTQALWFASPIFFAREAFDSPHLALWTAINPIVALCDVFRDPLLYNRIPQVDDWVTIGICVVASWALAIIIAASASRKTIHMI